MTYLLEQDSFCHPIDAQREELEAEFFAQYDARKAPFSSLDPETEALADEHDPLNPLPIIYTPQTGFCPDCEADVPF